MPQYAIGLDFGTNSCRSLLVDISDGTEIGSVVYDGSIKSQLRRLRDSLSQEARA